MLFNSYEFVFLFLPISILGYYFLVRKEKSEAAKVWMTAMSFWFYGSFRMEYLWVLSGSLIFNYGVILILKRKSIPPWSMSRRKKEILAVGIAGNLGLLFYVKYMNFFIENINGIRGGSWPLLQVLLPVGISFFTFQQISFLVDYAKGEIQKFSFIDYVLYISYFPKLTEGPIVTHEELFSQFRQIGNKKLGIEEIRKGMTLFVFGMAKKVLLADTFGNAVNYGYDNLHLIHSPDAILLVLFYALQLYFDFSGYCDMAMGISRIFGISLPLNFNSPYQAKNIMDFWKRWHITLSRFFTKYVYIPLGGNRKGTAVMCRNMLIVFFLSGLWHGAGWNFILWGMLHGGLYVFTRMWQRRKQGKESKGSVLLTFVYVSIAWVYFRARSVAQGNELLRLAISGGWERVNKNLAGYFNLDEFWYVLKVLRLDRWEYGHYLLMFVITAFSLVLVFWGKNAVKVTEEMKPRTWSAVFTAGLFFWCILMFSNVSGFLYFNF